MSIKTSKSEEFQTYGLQFSFFLQGLQLLVKQTFPGQRETVRKFPALNHANKFTPTLIQ